MYATNSRFTPTNGFIKQNLPQLREATDIEEMVLSPAAGGGIPATTIALTPGATQITAVLTAPTLPTGWTIVAAHVLAIKQQNPQVDDDYTLHYQTDASTPYSMLITGLTAATEYVVGGWFEYQKTPTQLAYGLAINDTATTP